MAEAEPLVVQIAPNDHPPFADICTVYGQALDSLGVAHQSILLGSPFAEPVPDATYLDLADPARSMAAGAALRRHVAGTPMLAICHRYRAYRVLRASRLRVPRVVTVAHEFGFFQRLQRRVERRLFASGVLFAGVSPAVQAELGRTVADPLLLPNAVNVAALDDARLTRDRALARLGVPESQAFTIGLVGRLVRKKAPALAIEALRVLVEEGRDVRLIVIGDGPLAGELAALARGLPVVFCGFVPGARNLLAALDVLLLTSEEVEAFGMVALEAMCAGVPVVAGPLPGPQFVLSGGGYYYLKREPREVAEALCQVQEDLRGGSLRERLDHARQRALREFSVAALARHLDDLFFRQAGSGP